MPIARAVLVIFVTAAIVYGIAGVWTDVCFLPIVYYVAAGFGVISTGIVIWRRAGDRLDWRRPLAGFLLSVLAVLFLSPIFTAFWAILIGLPFAPLHADGPDFIWFVFGGSSAVAGMVAIAAVLRGEMEVRSVYRRHLGRA